MVPSCVVSEGIHGLELFLTHFAGMDRIDVNLSVPLHLGFVSHGFATSVAHVLEPFFTLAS